MAILFDNAAQFGTAAALGTWTFALNVDADANFLIVGNSQTTNYASGVTYDGDAMTLIASKSTGGVGTYSRFWYLANPSSGTNNVAVTSGKAGSAGAVSYKGVDTSDPIGTPVTAGVTSNNISAVASSSVGELVVDTVGARNAGSLDLTVGAGQTQRYNQKTTGRSCGGSEEAGAGSVTMSWTADVSDELTLIAVPLKPAPLAFAPRSSMWFSEIQDFYDELKRGMISPRQLQRRHNEVYI